MSGNPTGRSSIWRVIRSIFWPFDNPPPAPPETTAVAPEASEAAATRPASAAAEAKTAPELSLYHYMSCPYCALVRSALLDLGLQIELRDIQRDADHREALSAATGRLTVPCLRIEGAGDSVEWMHESLDIVGYLKNRFA